MPTPKPSTSLTHLLLSSLLLLSCTTPSPPPAAQQEKSAPRSAEAPEPAAENAAADVLSVIDGDTIKVRLQDGTEEIVRVIGIDTPELHPLGCLGEEAAERMRELVAGASVTLLRKPQEERDTYGRLLRYVEANGADAGAVLIREGFAESLGAFPHPRLEEYEALEREARGAGKGIWGEACAS